LHRSFQELIVMLREDVVTRGRSDWPFTDPKPFLQWGLAGCGIAFLLYTLPIWVFQLTGINFGNFALTGNGWVLLRVLLLAVGILAAGAAVTTQPRSPAVLSLAALAALLAGWGMDPDWDSARLVMGLLVFLALFAAFLILLPLIVGKVFAAWEFTFSGHREPDVEAAEARGRFAGWVLSRVVVVVLVFMHFVGIACAIMSVPPPGRPPSWAAQQIWSVYQPYLQFLYLNNAYRFYSPEPGPPSLLWFYIEYADGSSRWLKLPTREEHLRDPLGQEFTRRLSIASSVEQLGQMNGPAPTKDRLEAGQRDGVPPHAGMSMEIQYRVPEPSSQKLLGEYARFVAEHFPSETNPNLEVKGVKIYRVVHEMLTPALLAEEGRRRAEPTDEWTYLPFYQGEFTKDGKLKDPHDPYLYWLIPIFRWPAGEKPNPFAGNIPPSRTGEYTVHNYLKVHARLRTKEHKHP
jgi:hypothetical protein